MTNTTAKSTQAAEEQLKWAGTGGGAGSKGAMLGEEVDREHRSEDNETHAN